MENKKMKYKEDEIPCEQSTTVGSNLNPVVIEDDRYAFDLNFPPIEQQQQHQVGPSTIRSDRLMNSASAPSPSPMMTPEPRFPGNTTSSQSPPFQSQPRFSSSNLPVLPSQALGSQQLAHIIATASSSPGPIHTGTRIKLRPVRPPALSPSHAGYGNDTRDTGSGSQRPTPDVDNQSGSVRALPSQEIESQQLAHIIATASSSPGPIHTVTRSKLRPVRPPALSPSHAGYGNDTRDTGSGSQRPTPDVGNQLRAAYSGSDLPALPSQELGSQQLAHVIATSSRSPVSIHTVVDSQWRPVRSPALSPSHVGHGNDTRDTGSGRKRTILDVDNQLGAVYSARQEQQVPPPGAYPSPPAPHPMTNLAAPSFQSYVGLPATNQPTIDRMVRSLGKKIG